MTRLIATLPLLFALTAPAFSATAQMPRQDVSQSQRQRDYWLSKDMQRLVFWQAPSQGAARR